MELKEKVVSLEAGQIHEVDDLLKKQKEKLLESIDIEREWRTKAHDIELTKRDIHIKQLEHQLEAMKSKTKNKDCGHTKV